MLVHPSTRVSLDDSSPCADAVGFKLSFLEFGSRDVDVRGVYDTLYRGTAIY